MKVYVVTEDGVDGVYAVCLRKEDADKHCEENSWLEVYEETVDTGGEPVFLLRGQDMFAVAGVIGYQKELIDHAQEAQASEVNKAIDEMLEWQEANATRIKRPDHEHVPAVEGGE